MPKSERNPLVHGSNLEQKENHRTKYRDVESKKYLSEIRTEYDKLGRHQHLLIKMTQLSLLG